MNLKRAFQLVRNMGWRYVGYRVKHEVEKRSGQLKKRFPINPEQKHWISLTDWRQNQPKFFFNGRDLAWERSETRGLRQKAERVLSGQIPFFSHSYYDLGTDYDWLTNPDSGFRYDPQLHWSEINDFGKESGDIKYVWEKSRFTYIHTIIRYDYHFNLDHSEWVFNEIDDWIKHNPINQGPNYRCSQEMALRLLNWCYALFFYKDSEALTEKRWEKYQHTIFWHLHHIYHHIDFSLIAVRNNHAITETSILTLSEFLFPFIPETKKWASYGRKWLEKEVAYQIYEDGTFLQFSHNYHRVVVQLLTLGISLCEINEKPLSTTVYKRAYKSLNFLYQNQQLQNGRLPNYGANDGALFFQWTDSEYLDYRPQLNSLHFLLTGESLYGKNKLIEEDSFWYGHCNWKFKSEFQELKQKQGISRFDIGGYYLIRDKEDFTFIRCGNHKDRPSQADNLHVDIWVKGQNVFHDSGSYKYNTNPEDVRYFNGTRAHNTIMIDDFDQMEKGQRFLWFYWSQREKVKIIETEEFYYFTGSVEVFQHVDKDIRHNRVIKKRKGISEWLVEDTVINKENRRIKQLWHTQPKMVQKISLEAHDSSGNPLIREDSSVGFSKYYGAKEDGIMFSFETNKGTITTQININ